MAYFLVTLGLVAGAVLWNLVLMWEQKHARAKQARQKLDTEISALKSEPFHHNPKTQAERDHNREHVRKLRAMIERLRTGHK